MGQKTKHSPLPFKAHSFMTESFKDGITGYQVRNADDETIFETRINKDGFVANRGDIGKATVKFIIRACNSHYELLEALELCHKGFQLGKLKDQSILPAPDPEAKQVKLLVLSEIVAAAIVKAKGN